MRHSCPAKVTTACLIKSRDLFLPVFGLGCLILLGCLLFSLFYAIPRLEKTGLPDEFGWSLLLNLRLPRALEALFSGMGLAVAGVIMQAWLRNPLAEPGLLGISSGASLGYAVALLLGFVSLSGLALAACIGAGLFCALTAILAQRGNTAFLLLAGLGLNALAGSLIGICSYIFDADVLRQWVFWGMGSFSGSDWTQVKLTLPIISIALSFTAYYWRVLNALLLGESGAQLLGVDFARLRWILLCLVALLVGVIVSLHGIIGFIGLLVPQLLRFFLGNVHQRLLPASALLGGSLLLVADTAAQHVLAPNELPVGLLTSLIGAPFFLFILWRQARYVAV